MTNLNLLTQADIQSWIKSYIGNLLDISVEEVDVNMSFDRYGLDSSAVVSLIGDLEHWLKIEISPNILFDYPNINALSEKLSKELTCINSN